MKKVRTPKCGECRQSRSQCSQRQIGWMQRSQGVPGTARGSKGGVPQSAATPRRVFRSTQEVYKQTERKPASYKFKSGTVEERTLVVRNASPAREGAGALEAGGSTAQALAAVERSTEGQVEAK